MTQRYLLRRGDVYYARISLSKKDQELLGRKEIWRSLKVSTQKEALEKLTMLNYKFASDKVGFMDSDDTLGNDKIMLLAEEYGKRAYNRLVQEAESAFYRFSQEQHDSTFDPFDSEEEHARERTLDELPNIDAKSAISFEFLPDLEARAVKRQKELAYASHEYIDKRIGENLKGFNLPKANDDKAERYSIFLLRQEFLKAEIHAIEKYKKEFEKTTSGHLTLLPITDYKELLKKEPQKAQAKTRTFGELVAAYNAAPENSRKKSPEMLENVRGYQKLLLDLIGAERPLDKLNTNTVRDLYIAIEVLPKNALKKYAGKTYLEIYELEQANPTDLPKMSSKTRSDYFQQLRSILEWAVTEKWIAVNPVGRAFKFTSDDNEPTRAPFSIDDLKALFSNVGFKDSKKEWPTGYWVPLLSLFTGMRLGEVLLLSVDEIRESNGIHHIALAANKMRGLKTAQSAREIPIPDIILKLGFIEYVEARKARKHEFVFDYGKAKNPIDAFGKVFGRNLTKLGIDDPTKVFHSFRHTFRDGIRLAEFEPIEAQIAHGLGGWKSSEVHERYGTGYTLTQKKRVIDLITGKGMAAASEIALAEAI
jgi:integrase